jgi:hypothetical protein
MAGYLDNYGVADQKRERLIKRVAIGSVVVVLLAVFLFLFLRTYSEVRVANNFLNTLRAHDYGQAYKIWGCTSPCKDYPMDKFMEDWGPAGVYKTAPEGKFPIVDVCGEGVVLTLQMPNADPVGLWVDRKNHTMSFAPWPRCPGRHLHLWEFIKSKFS